MWLGCLAFLTGLAAGAAAAAEVHDCRGYEAAAENLAEPWEANTRTFANGAVRIAVLDTVEPAGSPFHLLVISPPYDELGLRQCRVVSYLAPPDGSATGFGFLGLDGMSAGYHPDFGLQLDIPLKLYNPATGDFDVGGLHVQINQATGEILAEEYGS